MLAFLQEGGFPIWFLLGFGLLTLFSAARFAAGPDAQRLRLTASLGGATLFATLTAICADLAAVGHHAPEYLAQHPTLSLSAVLLQGAAEAMSPAIVGFTLLALGCVVVALGFKRETFAA